MLSRTLTAHIFVANPVDTVLQQISPSFRDLAIDRIEAVNALAEEYDQVASVPKSRLAASDITSSSQFPICIMESDLLADWHIIFCEIHRCRQLEADRLPTDAIVRRLTATGPAQGRARQHPEPFIR